MSPPFASKGFELKTIVKQAIAKDYTDIVIINEDKKTPNALVHIHLPDGPTAHYKLSRWGASGVSWSWGCTLHALRASVRVCLPSHALRHFFFFSFFQRDTVKQGGEQGPRHDTLPRSDCQQLPHAPGTPGARKLKGRLCFAASG